MADINLLQSAQPSQNDPIRRAKIFTIVSAVIFGLALVIGIFIFFSNRSSDSQIQNLSTQKNDTINQIMANKDYGTLVVDQRKIKDLQTLLDKHLDWSKLLPKFFDATLTSASYSRFQAQSDGSALITGNVATFVDLDKLIQAYQLTDFSSYIKDVQLVNIGFSTDLNKPGITFTIKVIFNQDIIKAQAASTLVPASGSAGGNAGSGNH